MTDDSDKTANHAVDSLANTILRVCHAAQVDGMGPTDILNALAVAAGKIISMVEIIQSDDHALLAEHFMDTTLKSTAHHLSLEKPLQ